MAQTLFSFQQLGRLQNTVGQQKHHNSFSSHANKIVASSILLEHRAPSFIPAQLIGRLVEAAINSLQNNNPSPLLSTTKTSANRAQRDAKKVNEIALKFQQSATPWNDGIKHGVQDIAHDLLIRYLVDDVYKRVDTPEL